MGVLNRITMRMAYWMGLMTAHWSRVQCPPMDVPIRQDGLVNHVDECVLEPGARFRLVVQIEMPMQADYRDGCPDQQTSLLSDPKRSDGCPALAFVSPDSIEMTRIVSDFSFLRKVKGESHQMLMAVAKIMRDHPDIRLVQITGHADEVGDSDFNQGLSVRRAAAVKRYLVEEGGVEADRLVVRGYGESLPMDTNRTESVDC